MSLVISSTPVLLVSLRDFSLFQRWVMVVGPGIAHEVADTPAARFGNFPRRSIGKGIELQTSLRYWFATRGWTLPSAWLIPAGVVGDSSFSTSCTWAFHTTFL